MLIISLLSGFAGLVSEIANTQDWWQPITITNTRIGFEDFIIGFSVGGVASIVYEEIYKRRIVTKRASTLYKLKPISFLVMFVFLFLALFYIFNLGSFYSMFLTYLSFSLYMLFKRPDLIINSLISGIFMLIIGIEIYLLLFIIHPSYIQDFWYLKNNWYWKLILGIPAGEYIFYFLTGAFIGPLYEFLKNAKLSKLKKI